MGDLFNKSRTKDVGMSTFRRGNTVSKLTIVDLSRMWSLGATDPGWRFQHAETLGKIPEKDTKGWP